MTSKRCRVLIVDRSNTCRKVHNRLLTKAGYDCVLPGEDVKSEPEVFDFVKRALLESTYTVTYGLILTGGDFHLIQAIRNLGYVGAILVITGNYDVEETALLKNLGADDVISKPLDHQGLNVATAAFAVNSTSRNSANSIEGDGLTRVLILDDIASSRKIHSRLLTRDGYCILEADGLQAAIRSLQTHQFGSDNSIRDVVLISNTFQSKPALEVIQHIRKLGFKSLIFGLSGSKEDAQHFMSSGASGSIIKPLTLLKFQDAIQASLEPKYKYTPRRLPIACNFQFENLRILVVDQSATCRKIVRHILAVNGNSVVEAASSEPALTMVRNTIVSQAYGGTGFDAVVMSHSLDGCGGPTTARRLREMGFTGLILGVTASDDSKAYTELKAAGADAVYPKPLDFFQFVRALQDARDPCKLWQREHAAPSKSVTPVGAAAEGASSANKGINENKQHKNTGKSAAPSLSAQAERPQSSVAIETRAASATTTAILSYRQSTRTTKVAETKRHEKSVEKTTDKAAVDSSLGGSLRTYAQLLLARVERVISSRSTAVKVSPQIEAAGGPQLRLEQGAPLHERGQGGLQAPSPRLARLLDGAGGGGGGGAFTASATPVPGAAVAIGTPTAAAVKESAPAVVRIDRPRTRALDLKKYLRVRPGTGLGHGQTTGATGATDATRGQPS